MTYVVNVKCLLFSGWIYKFNLTYNVIVKFVLHIVWAFSYKYHQYEWTAVGLLGRTEPLERDKVGVLSTGSSKVSVITSLHNIYIEANRVLT